jgi:hypothetical protein
VSHIFSTSLHAFTHIEYHEAGIYPLRIVWEGGNMGPKVLKHKIDCGTYLSYVCCIFYGWLSDESVKGKKCAPHSQ